MSQRRNQGQRQLLAEQAARWMSENALDDPGAALRRVLARQPALPDRRLWPDAAEILAALRDYQHLFRGGDQPAHLAARRQSAIEAMRFFTTFRPRLVGAVLEGTADANSPVQLHLHHDDVEQVLLFLHEHDIPHQLGERRIHLDARGPSLVPQIGFDADGTGFQLLLLPLQSERQGPLQADGRTPMQRAALPAVLRL